MEALTQYDLADIQGLVVRGYKELPAARYVLLKVVESSKAKTWCERIIPKITSASNKPVDTALNIAWTHQGLAAIRFSPQIAERFSNEFRSGMNTEHKRRTLGDYGENAPESWKWAGPRNEPVHLLLLMYARDADALDSVYAAYSSQFAKNGLEEIHLLTSESLPDGKEHFGFKDGIAQPYVAQFDRTGKRTQEYPVALGEILLGYKNAYGRYTQRPLVDADHDPQSLLPADIEGSQKRDLGKNGTYLVFRQLEQDVAGFWSFMKKHSYNGNSEQAVYLASKMIGRWPSGAPLVKAHDADDPHMKDQDNFMYHHQDVAGLKCPLGAHIRRTNPRDSLEPEPGTRKSIEFSNRHRILRRGRSYGKPVTPTVNPHDYLQQFEQMDAGANEERGLFFICLNANIGRQFEFVQHTWSNNANFNGLYEDPDPITGIREVHGNGKSTFTIQTEPVRKRISDLPQFIKVRGGAYFFMPGISALKYIATAPEV